MNRKPTAPSRDQTTLQTTARSPPRREANHELIGQRNVGSDGKLGAGSR
jgi:hypothetical protein